jgi:hypothetical protein
MRARSTSPRTTMPSRKRAADRYPARAAAKPLVVAATLKPANLHDLTAPMLLPGIKINTSPTDFASIKQIQMARFDGERRNPFGSVVSGEANG